MSDGPSQLVVDPRDERLIHRLEAFSDIVIGFSLALLAINLAVPKTIAELPAHYPEVATFLVCFGLVALLWWFHNRTFALFYVANAASIVLNFVMLVGVVLLVYGAQMVSNQGRSLPFDPHGYLLAMGLWMSLYAIVLMLLGGMTAIGLRARWSELADPVRAWGAKQSINGLVGGLTALAIGLLIPRVPYVYAGFVSVLAFVTLIVERIAVPRILAKGTR